MRKTNKFLLMLLATVMVVSLVAGCAGKNDSGNNAGSNTGSSDKPNESGNVEISDGYKNGKFSPEVTISVVGGTDSTLETKPGETLENNFVTQWAKDSLGINFDYLWIVPKDQVETKVRLMLTSGEKLPDVIWANGTLLNDLLESGQFKEIGADFDLYASEAMKEAYKDPELWQLMVRDDKKMGIPVFERAGQNNGLMFVRQDWLDQLDLQAPTTFDELEVVLRAFKENADKLGVKDLVPLGLSLKSGTRGWFGESTWVFGPFGSIPGQWVEAEDGSLVYGSTHPGMKEGLTLLSQWYKDGLLSKEVGLHDENKVSELAMQGKVGVIVSPAWSAGWPYLDMSANIPGAVMKAHPLPSANGVAAGMDSNYLSGGLLVHKDFKNTDALFLYLNKVFETKNPPVGSEFEKGFKEGYDYVIKADGTVSVDENDFPDKTLIYPEKFFVAPMQDPYLELKISADLVNGKEPVTPAEKQGAVAYANNPAQTEATAQIYNTIDQYVPNAYLGAPTKTQVDKGALLDKMEFEKILEFIYGKTAIDKFDDFVKDYNNAGGAQVAKEVNEVHSQMQGK